MWPYLAAGALVSLPALSGGDRRQFTRFAFLTFLLLTLFVGLRHHIGMDWNNYLYMIDKAKTVVSYAELGGVSEPLFAILLVIGGWTGFDMYFVNLVSAVIVCYGLYVFARQAPEPWLALMAALPMYVVVMGMGLNRQALAAALLMILIANWHRWRQPARVGMILLASGFHASALIFLIFVGLDLKIRPVLKFAATGLFALAMIYLLQRSGQAEYYEGMYGSGAPEEYQSSGALVHVVVNGAPALAYFLFPRLRPVLFPDRLLQLMAIAAVATIPLALVFPNAAGRMSLYWFPVSMWFWGVLPRLFSEKWRKLIRFLICALMLALIYGWLTFANSAFTYVPYRSALLMQRAELDIGYAP